MGFVQILHLLSVISIQGLRWFLNVTEYGTQDIIVLFEIFSQLIKESDTHRDCLVKLYVRLHNILLFINFAVEQEQLVIGLRIS